MARILVIKPGYVPPDVDAAHNPFAHLSPDHSGVVLSPVWGERPKESRSDRCSAVGSFQFFVTRSYGLPEPIRSAWDIVFMIFQGWRLHRRQAPFDIIISYGTNKTGIVGSILKLLTGAKYVVELPGSPAAAYRFDRVSRTFTERGKESISALLFRWTVHFADHLKLLYPQQVEQFAFAGAKPRSVFHDFCGVGSLVASGRDDGFILFLGSPWYLKGVDVLIRAFLSIAESIPQYRLRIVGSTPDESEFRDLAMGHPRIDFEKGVPYERALELISTCSLFVLPSRTEAMGKVLLEARALKKPVIASNVDGIPFYVEDQVSGLLFESEDVTGLAEKMKTVLLDDQYSERLAIGGSVAVREKYSESEYRRAFNEMVDQVLASAAR